MFVPLSIHDSHLCLVGLVDAVRSRHRPCLGASDASDGGELTSTGLPLGHVKPPKLHLGHVSAPPGNWNI